MSENVNVVVPNFLAKEGASCPFYTVPCIGEACIAFKLGVIELRTWSHAISLGVYDEIKVTVKPLEPLKRTKSFRWPWNRSVEGSPCPKITEYHIIGFYHPKVQICEAFRKEIPYYLWSQITPEWVTRGKYIDTMLVPLGKIQETAGANTPLLGGPGL